MEVLNEFEILMLTGGSVGMLAVNLENMFGRQIEVMVKQKALDAQSRQVELPSTLNWTRLALDDLILSSSPLALGLLPFTMSLHSSPPRFILHPSTPLQPSNAQEKLQLISPPPSSFKKRLLATGVDERLLSLHTSKKSKLNDDSTSGYATPPLTSSPAKEGPFAIDASTSSSSPPISASSSAPKSLLPIRTPPKPSSILQNRRFAQRPNISSTPPRDAPSSSASSFVPTETLHAPVLTPSVTYIFGRSRHHAPLLPIATALPSQLLPLPLPLTSSKPYLLPLPRSANHASRTHCVLQLSSPSLLRISVLGQNGVRINGKRVTAGSLVWLDQEKTKVKGPGDCDVKLGFWGGIQVVVPWPRVERKALEREARAPSSPLTDGSGSGEEMEEEMEGEDGDVSDIDLGREELAVEEDEDDEEEEEDAQSEEEEDLPVIASRNKPSAFASLPPSSPPPMHLLSSPPLPSRTYSLSPSPSPSPQKEPASSRQSSIAIRPLPATVDLAAMMASTLVFSHQTSISLKDLTRLVLEGQPSLKRNVEEDVQVWEEWVGQELQGAEMWGRIERKGKVSFDSISSSAHPDRSKLSNWRLTCSSLLLSLRVA
jgi:hypothetical protein